jgi:hypothetical protein
VTIELKGLSREQVTNLLPEGLISLCWRGSVAHGMYVPKSDPDSIDDKDVMGIYIAPIEHYLGFGRQDVERADGPELLSIKRGEWPLEKVKAEAERLFQLAQEAYVHSSLPPEPDRDRAEKVCVKMIAEYHGLNIDM